MQLRNKNKTLTAKQMCFRKQLTETLITQAIF